MRPVVVSACFLLLAAAGCGGLSAGEYADKVSGIADVETQKERQEQIGEAVEEGNDEAHTDLVREAVEDVQDQVADLQGLDPPEELEALHQRLVDTTRRSQEVNERTLAALSDGDEAGAQAASTEAQQIEQELRQLEGEFAAQDAEVDLVP